MNPRTSTQFFAGLISALTLLTWLIAKPVAVGADVTLKFATHEFPPFAYTEDGKLAGPAVEIVKAVCERQGIAYTIEVLPWSRAVLYAQKCINGYGAIFMVSPKGKEKDWLTLSHPLILTYYGFFVHADDPLTFGNFKGVEDLVGYTIGVYGPSDASETLEQINNKLRGSLEIDMTYKSELNFRKLSSKRIKAVFSNKNVGFAIMIKEKLKNIRYIGSIDPITYHVGFNLKCVSAQSVKSFNDGIEELYKDFKIQSILMNYSLQSAAHMVPSPDQ